MLGNDLSDRQRDIAEYADCQLTAWNELLYHHLVVVLRRFLDRGGEICPFLHHRKADRGSLLRRFYHHGKAQYSLNLLDRRGCHQPISRLNLFDAEQLFRKILVHRQSTREVSTSGVLHVCHVQQRLDRSVFALSAMKRQKDDVCILDLVHRRQVRQKRPFCELR